MRGHALSRNAICVAGSDFLTTLLKNWDGDEKLSELIFFSSGASSEMSIRTKFSLDIVTLRILESDVVLLRAYI